MSDVSKVGREKGPEPQGPKRKKKYDTEAFKEMMKVGKVRETDPEEKRKRKKQAEAEEEMKAEQAAQPPPQQGLPPPPTFEPRVSGAQQGEEPSVAPSEGPVSGPSTTPPPSQQPSQPQGPTQTPAKGGQPTAPAGQKPAKQAAPSSPPTSKEKAAEKKAEGGMVPFAPAPLKEEKQPAKKTAKKTQEPIEAPPLPVGAWESIKESSKKEEPKAEITEGLPTTQPTPQLAPQAAPPPPGPMAPIASPFAHLPPQVAQMFDRMVGVMTVMQETGVKETTINLTNPQFEKSIFFGSQIVITEFSTAPKEYNIQLLGNQSAVTSFQNNQEELMAAFQAGNYNFKVNRLEVGYLAAPEKTKRKETKRVTRKKKGDL